MSHWRHMAILAAVVALAAASAFAKASADKPAAEKSVTATSTSKNIDPGDWPQWRGPYRDGVSQETGLLDKWPEGGPPLAWKMSGLGQGVAAVVTCKGRLYTLGNKDKSAVVQCFDLATQKQVWSCKVAQGFDQGERASPVVDNGQVFGCTGNSTFFGIDADGKLMWKMNARADLHGDMQHIYGYSETPLVDGDQVVFHARGQGRHDGGGRTQYRQVHLEDACPADRTERRGRPGQLFIHRGLQWRRRASVRATHRAGPHGRQSQGRQISVGI